LVAALPPALAIYFELMGTIPKENISRQVRTTLEDMGLSGEDKNATETIVTSITIGAFAVHGFRPTVVAVSSTSLSLIYELRGQNAFFGAAALVVVLLILLPIISRIESLDYLKTATFYIRRRGLISPMILISGAIIVLNLALIGLCWLTYHLTKSTV